MNSHPQQDIIHADADSLLRSLPPESTPLIIADPPYGIGYHSNHCKDKNPHDPISHDWNFQIGSFLESVATTLKDTDALYLFCRYDVTPIWIPYLQPSGLKLKTVIAWVKDNWSAGDLNGSFGNQYECIIFAAKGRHQLRGKRWSNVWEFPRVPAKRLLHPAQKPTELLIRAIQASSDPGDVVVDPYCGSGSTGEAAIACGRGFILGDIDKKMVALTKRRLGLETDQDEPDQSPLHTTPFTLDDDPLDWGLHPEDLAFLRDQFTGPAAESRVKHALSQRLLPLE
jgi:site-specific DNA-methyltransferase (adenine-specific)